MTLGIDFARFEASPALIAAGSTRIWTYGDIHAETRWFSRQLGGGNKSLMFSFCRNDAASLIAYIGALESGHAIAMLDGTLPASLQASLVARYRPDWIFESAATEPGAEPVFAPLYELAATSPSGMRMLQRRSGTEAEPVHPSLALLLPTSGTTGSPKLVRLSAANLRANALSIREYLRIDHNERPALCLPIHYSYGLSVVNSHLLSGACIVLPAGSIVRPEFWECCRIENCTSLAAVPYMYQMLEKIGFERRVPGSLKTLTQAGGKLDERLVLKFDSFMKERNGRFFVMYGQTEATARMSYLPPGRLPEKLGSAGIPIPGGKFRIENDEVIYSGPNVMLGYAEQRDDLSRGDDMLGMLRTGDLGYLDAEGFLFINGRSKRIVKLYGHRINLDEVEKKLQEHSSVLGPVAVVGMADSLVIYCERGDSADFERLRAELSEIYRLNANSFKFKSIGALPTTSSGKINYQVLQNA